MTEAAIAQTTQPDSGAAGRALGQEIAAALPGPPPDVVIVFASSRYAYGELLSALDAACHPALLVGCSSAGEFTTDTQQEGAACALALRSAALRFSAGLGRGLREDRAAAAAALAESFQGLTTHAYRYRTALIFTDALTGHADDLVAQLTRLTAGTYQFAGGGAGDDARFSTTHVFFGTEAVADAAVSLEILSNKPIGIGVSHGWQPASPPLRATETNGMRLHSLNAVPTVEAFEEHAEVTRQTFDPAAPLPFFLNNVLGIATEQGYQLRVPLTAAADGSVLCAADIPAAATVHFMGATEGSAATAAAQATRAALAGLGSATPKVALFFDCVATRLRLGAAFENELACVGEALGPVPFAGCNTYGQIARAEGQFSGFHNCTAVVCIIPE